MLDFPSLTYVSISIPAEIQTGRVAKVSLVQLRLEGSEAYLALWIIEKDVNWKYYLLG